MQLKPRPRRPALHCRHHCALDADAPRSPRWPSAARMVEVEEFEDEEEQQQQHEADDAGTDDADSDAAAADEADAAAAASSASAPFPPLGDQFQHLLQLASHLKSSQPEVREKRAQWDRLQFHQKNTVLWQKQDAAVRYDLAAEWAAPEQASAAAASSASAAAASSSAAVSASSTESRFERVRFPLALHFKSLAGAAFARGTAAAATQPPSSSSAAAAASAFQEASLSYQRAMGLFAWGRKSQSKDGDEIEWRDLTDAKAVEKDSTLAATTGRKTNQGTPEELEAAAAATDAFYLPAPILTAQQRQHAQQFLFTCLVNVAACEEKLQQWTQVIAVCEAALAMDLIKHTPAAAAATGTDGFNLAALTVKALFRAATAYTRLDELERSLALLTRASKLSPKDAVIAAELTRLRTTLDRQREKDKKHFGGFLQRKEALTESEAEEEAETERKKQRANTAAASASAASSSASAAVSASTSASAASPSAGVSMAAADQTKQFLSSYLAGFREQAAKDRAAGKLPQSAAKAKPRKAPDADGDDDVDDSLDTSSASALRSRAPAGVPSTNEDLASLYADARANFGLDLSDPLVQQELQRLQDEHRRTGKIAKPADEDSNSASASVSAGRAASSSSSLPPRVELQKRHRDGALGPSDLASTEPAAWRGGFVLFCIIVAAVMRWMKIL